MKKYFLIFCLLISSVPAAGYDYTGQYEYTDLDIDVLIEQIRRESSDAQKIPLLLKLASMYEESDLESFKKYTQEAIVLASKAGNDQALADAYNNKAKYYAYTGQFEPAIDNFMLALEYATVSNDKGLLIGVRGSLGNTYFQMGQYAQAKKHYRYAEKIASTHESDRLEYRKAALALNIGNTEVELKEYDLAEKSYEKATTLYKALAYNKGVADALLNTGSLHIKRDKNWDKGFTYLKQALELHKKIEYPRNKANILNTLALYYNYKKQYDQAIAYAEQMITLSKDINAPDLLAVGEKTLFIIYSDIEDYEKALTVKESYETRKDAMLNETTISKIIAIETQLETQEKEQQLSALDAELDKKTNRQKYTLLSSLIILLMTTFISGYIYRQKRNLAIRVISVNEENEILKQSNLDLKSRLLNLADRIEKTKAGQPESKTKKYIKSSLKNKEKQEYIHALLTIMEQKKPYLNTDLKLTDLAEMVPISSNQLSELLNETMGKNYYEFINIYRVEEAKQIMSQAQALDKKLFAIAYEAGFNSKASFNRVFKNITGTSPSTYKSNILQPTDKSPINNKT